jgi:hypothetical protein
MSTWKCGGAWSFRFIRTRQCEKRLMTGIHNQYAQCCTSQGAKALCQEEVEPMAG